MQIKANKEINQNDKERQQKQIDRTDSLLGGYNAANSEELPLHDPTGEKTRKTYDFTRKSCINYSTKSISFSQCLK